MPVKKAAPKGVDVDKFLEELVLGRHDARLAEIFATFTARLKADDGAVRWRLTWDGLVVDEDNLTLLECETAEMLSGKTWISLDPKNSARDCVSVLAAAMSHRRQISVKEARDQLADLTVMDVADNVRSEYLAVPAPLGGPTSVAT